MIESLLYVVCFTVSGHFDHIREGASVSCVDGECKMQGILVLISSADNSGEVSVDESTYKIVKLAKLTAIDNVDVPRTFRSSLIVQAMDVISSFLASQNQFSNSSTLPIIETQRVCWTAILRLWSLRGSQLINFLNRDVKARLLKIMSERSVCLHEQDSVSLRTAESKLFELLKFEPAEIPEEPASEIESIHPFVPPQWLTERGGDSNAKVPLVAFLSKTSSVAVSINKNRISNSQFVTAAVRSTQSVKVGTWLFEIEFVTIPVLNPDSQPLSFGILASDKPDRYEEGSDDLHSFKWPNQMKSGDRLVCCVDAVQSGLTECTFFLNNQPLQPDGCSATCSRSHPNYSMCLRCSQRWGTHSGHGCPGTGQRGSFRNETQIDSKISFQRGRKQLFAFISLAPGVVIDAHFVDSDIQFKQDVGSGKTYFAWHQQPKKMPLQAPPYPFAAWSDLGKVDDQISQMMEAHPKADGSIVLKHKELTPAETQKLDLINSKLRLQKKWLNFLDGFSVHVKWNIKLAEMLSKLLSCGSNTVVLENGGLLKFFRADVEFESHFDSIGDSSAIVWVANQREHRIHISGSKYLSFECNQDSAGPDFEILNSNALHHVSVWRFALTPAQVSSVFAFDVQQLHADLAESPTSSVGQLSSGFLGPSWWNSEDPASAWSQGRTVLENPPSFRPAGSRSFDVVEFEPGTYFCNGNSTETTGKFPVCLTSGVWYYECMLVSRTQSNQGNQGIDISSGSTNVNIGFAHSTFDAEPSSSLGMSGLHAWAFDVDRRDWCFGGDRSDSGCRQSLGDSVGIIANLESPSREFWLVMSGQFFGPLSTNFSLESGITPHVSFKPNSGILVKFSAHNMRYFSLALDKFPTLRPIVFGADDGNSIRDQIKLRSNPNSLLDPSVFHKHRSGAIQTNWKFTNLRDQSSCVLNAEGHLASCSSDSMSSLKADQSVTGGCWVYQAVMKEACRHRIGWCVSPRNSTAKCGEDNSSWGFDCKSKDKYHNQDSNDWGAYGQVGDTISAVCSFEHVFVEFAYFVNDRCIGVAFRSTSVNSPLSPFISIGEGKFQLNCSLTSLRFLSDIRKIYPKVLPIEVPAHLLSPLGLDIASEPSLSLMKFPISWLKQAESAISEITIQETSVNSSSDSNSQTSSTSVVPYVSMLKSKAAKFRVISDWLVAHSSRLATEDKFSGDVSLCRALISSKQYAETDVVNSILSSNGNHAVAVKSLRLQQPLAESVSSADFEMITAMLHKVPTVSAPLPMINHHAIDWFKIDDEETQIEKAPVVAGEFQHDVISDLTHQNYDAVHTAFENRLQVATARRALLKYIQSAVQHDDNIGQFLLHDVLPHSADATHATQPLLNILMRFVLLSKDLEEIENLRVVLSSLVRKFSVSSSAHAPGFFEAISDELFLQLIFLIRDSIKDEQLSHSELAIVDGKTAHTELLLFLLKFVIHECKHSPILVSQLLPTRVLSVLMQLSFPRISSQTALKVSEKFPLHLLQHVVSVLSIPTAISQLPVGLIEDLSRSWFEMSTQLISSENKSYLDTNFQSPDTSFSFSPIAQGAVAVCILIAAKCQAQKPDWLNSLTDFCVLQSYLVSTSAQEASSPGAQISEGKIELLSTTLRDALKNDFTQSSASNAEFCVDDAELVALMNRSMDSRGRIAFGDKSMFKSLTQASEPVLKARSNVLEAFSSFVI
jgi:tellurite resistance protein